MDTKYASIHIRLGFRSSMQSATCIMNSINTPSQDHTRTLSL